MELGSEEGKDLFLASSYGVFLFVISFTSKPARHPSRFKTDFTVNASDDQNTNILLVYLRSVAER